jgi:hypothetical protein
LASAASAEGEGAETELVNEDDLPVVSVHSDPTVRPAPVYCHTSLTRQAPLSRLKALVGPGPGAPLAGTGL